MTQRAPELTPQERREVDEKKQTHRDKQPYATELADLDLERAQKEKRPTETNENPGNR